MEIFIFLCLLVIFISIFWIYRRTNTKIDALNAQLIETKTLQGQTTQSFGQIQSSLGRLTEASRHMEEVGKDIASLSDILRAPKLRGGIGELLLGDLLSQILSPEHYKLQHSFSSGDRVDAVIILKVGMVPVDAKFPLESFQRMITSSEEEGQKKHKREFTRAVKGHARVWSIRDGLPSTRSSTPRRLLESGARSMSRETTRRQWWHDISGSR